jgi:hypothetical protein
MIGWTHWYGSVLDTL